MKESLSVAEALHEFAADDAGLGAELVGYSPYVLSYVLPVWTLIEMGCLRDAEIRAHRGPNLRKSTVQRKRALGPTEFTST